MRALTGYTAYLWSGSWSITELDVHLINMHRAQFTGNGLNNRYGGAAFTSVDCCVIVRAGNTRNGRYSIYITRSASVIAFLVSDPRSILLS